MKNKICIFVVIFCLVLLTFSLIIVSGRDIKILNIINECWEATIIIREDHLDGYTENSIKETVYELQGKDVIALKELIRKKTLCRRRFERGGFSSQKTDDRKRIIIIMQDNEDTDFSLELVFNKMVLISDISNNHLKNLNNDYESEILMFLSNYDPVKEEIY